MSEFRPPTIQSTDTYKVEDIIVLYELNKRPTHVADPLKAFSGHRHIFYDEYRFIKFAEVVSRLLEKGLIRENYPEELLPKITIPELKIILQSIGEKTSGTKKVLIERIKELASDEDIINHTDKTYFVLTELGNEILEKYDNVIWIYLHKENIFRYPIFYKSKLNEKYFLKHWDKDPAKTIIEHYEPKESGIVARVYDILNEPEKTFLYGIKKFTEDLSVQMNKCKESGYCDIKYGLGELSTISIISVYNSINMTEQSLDETLRYIYDYAITDATLLHYDLYKEIIVLLLTANPYDSPVRERMDELADKIRSEYGHEEYDFEYADESEYEEESILEMLHAIYDDENKIEELILGLVDELPSETLNKLKDRIKTKLGKES